MVRLIDADALKKGIKELKQSPWYNNDINPSWRQGIKDAVHVVEMLCIEEAPTVEAVPVVRCRECKHHKGYNGDRLYGMQDAFMAMDDDYCSRAERREDEPDSRLDSQILRKP